MRSQPARIPILLCGLAAGCGFSSGSSATPNTGQGLLPEILFCRSRIDSPIADSEISLRTAQNLGTGRVGEKSGRELGVRLHPDGKTVVFARQRTSGSERSREIHISSIDGSTPELRLTADSWADDDPCWSPDGSWILFSSDRAGERRLWRCEADGSGQREFLAADPGTSDSEPDVDTVHGRFAFSRLDPSGIRRIWTVGSDGTGPMPRTRGTAAPSAQSPLGDREPSFAPDGNSLLFVRRLAAGTGLLMALDLDTGAERILFDPSGDVARPRWSRSADRIFLGIDQPAEGRPGPRLAALRADGTDPLLIVPDKRFVLDGIDVLPSLAPAPDPGPDVELPPPDVRVEAGVLVLGAASLLADLDGAEMILATQTFGNHEVAGIDCSFSIPAEAEGYPLAIRVEATARVSRFDNDTAIRLGILNPVAGRQDTVVEISPGSGAPRRMAFSTQSLAHVSRERTIGIGVIAEIARGNRAELCIDQVRVAVTPLRAAGN
ncbi:MAG: hypothetical protein Fur0037_26660 [Planctomycetota bacterium]